MLADKPSAAPSTSSSRSARCSSCVCGYLALTAPTPQPGVTLTDLLNSNPANYNLSLGHIFDLTAQAMGFFRGPLLAVALGMLTLGPIAYLVRRRGRTFAANLLIAAAMIAVLLAAHEGLARFYPILGSKDLALAIDSQLRPGDLIVIDGELTSGSTLLFYTPQRARAHSSGERPRQRALVWQLLAGRTAHLRR